MSALTSILPDGLKYDHIIGTGGIGSGIFFALQGNETLGREESRMAELLPYKDYCKQHIIMHYIAVLLGAGEDEFISYPIGKVGNDGTGRYLLQLMDAAGMITDHVKVSKEHATLFSVCYQYPDHAGGNITTSAIASSNVLPTDIDKFFQDFDQPGVKEIILAAPEVPVETRIRLLEYGRKRGSLNVASLLSAEVATFKDFNGFAITDILFINLDETKKIARLDETTGVEAVIIAAIKNLLEINADITVFITCGAQGVYCYSHKRLEFFPSIPVEVVSTAGAGDAFLAGTLVGITCGLPFFKNSKENASILTTATELGILVAAISVTSQDSIHMGINKDYLFEFINSGNLGTSEEFLKLFD